MASGWGWIILAEVVNAERGLGYLIDISNRRGHTNAIFAIIIVIVLIAVACDQLWRLGGQLLFPYTRRGSRPWKRAAHNSRRHRLRHRPKMVAFKKVTKIVRRRPEREGGHPGRFLHRPRPAERRRTGRRSSARPAAANPRCCGSSPGWNRISRRPAGKRTSSASRSRSRARTAAWWTRSTRCCPHLTVLDNIAFGLKLRGVRPQGPARPRPRVGEESRPRGLGGQVSLRAVWRACSSECPSPPR